MARAVSDEEIFAACTRYWREHGRDPNAAVLRGLLGNRGSLGTLQAALNGWRRARDAGDFLEVPGMDEDFVREWTTIGERVWRLAMERAEREISSVRESATKEIARAREDAQAAQELYDEQQEQLETLLPDKARLEGEVSELARKLALAEGAVNESRVSAADERRQREALEIRVQELIDAFQEERIQTATANERAAQVEKRLVEVLTELAANQRRIEGLTEVREASLKNEARYEHTIEMLSNEVQELRDARDEEQVESERLQREVEELSTVGRQAQAALDEMRRETGKLTEELDEARKRGVQAEAALEEARQYAARIESRNENLVQQLTGKGESGRV